MSVHVEIPRYKAHKVVRAAKITALRPNGVEGAPDLVLGEIGGIVTMLPDWHAKHTPHVGGYFVLYEDGYESFSPAKAFEEGYTRFDGSEAKTVDHLIEAKIKGTQPLTHDQATLINHGKDLAEQVGRFVQLLRQADSLDQRWVSIGATDLQTGFMALTRAIAQPTTF